MAKLEYIHPGDILFHEFLQPMGISRSKLARDISVPRIRRYVLLVILVVVKNSGWDYRVIMIWKKPEKNWVRHLTRFQPLRENGR